MSVTFNIGDRVNVYVHPVGRVDGRVVEKGDNGRVLIEYLLHDDGETRVATTWQMSEECRALR